MTVLVLKLVLAPALIAAATWIGRRWGPDLGGWFVALPLTSGPTLLVIALEQGPRFARETGLGALLAVISLATFALAYSWSSRRATWPASTLAGCATFLAATWLLEFVRWPLTPTLIGAWASLFAALRLMPPAARLEAAATPPRWDVPLRMALAAASVLALTTAASHVGPRLSGLLTPFPVAATLLAVFTHAGSGPAAVGQLFRGLLRGLFSFTVFLCVLVMTIDRGIVVAFTLALVSTLAVHGGVRRGLGHGGVLRAVESGQTG